MTPRSVLATLLAACVASACSFNPGGENPVDTCGNSVTDGDEECDDGNTSDGDSCSADCSVATCLAPVTHPTVAALLADDTCTTAYVASGVYNERVTIVGDRHLLGVGPSPPTLNGEMLGTTLTVESGQVTVEGIAVTGGLASIGGGIVNSAELQLINVSVSGNMAVPGDDGLPVRGGGIAHLAGTLTLDGSAVMGNVSDGGDVESIAEGGGIYAAASVTLTGASQVVGNEVRLATFGLALGGGISAHGTVLNVQGSSSVAENRIVATAGAFAFGGGIYADSGAVTCTGGEVRENTAAADGTGQGDYARGGGLYLDVEASFIATGGTAIVGNAAEVTGENLGASGGGVYSSGDVTLRDVTLSENRTDLSGAIAVIALPFGSGGGLKITGFPAVEIADSVVENNQVLPIASPLVGTYTGGAIDLTTPSSTGIATMTIDRTRFEGNAVSGFVAGGGGLYIDARARVTTRITESLFSSNRATSEEGGTGSGGALHVSAGDTTTLEILNSTITGNVVSDDGGGIFARNNSLSPDMRLKVSFSTIANNSAGSAGVAAGVSLTSNVDNPTQFIFSHTILDKNSASASADCRTNDLAVLAGSQNLINNQDACAIELPAENLVGAAVTLGPLADNGGPTATHAISAGGAATDAGSAECLDARGLAQSTDQRQLPRPVGGVCDIGAFELQ